MFECFFGIFILKNLNCLFMNLFWQEFDLFKVVDFEIIVKIKVFSIIIQLNLNNDQVMVCIGKKIVNLCDILCIYMFVILEYDR